MLPGINTRAADTVLIRIRFLRVFMRFFLLKKDAMES
jgi:hypothetical protein